ncbi:molybdenum cofactor guanylyltransferase [Cohnella pontilimi]|uniref:Probable molybdenum cofactor guanylyltransferase n=1 Tax=Cohnella pontilimi TaxID=2564100 RepID=A0A4U0F9G2_9BACL|nr:molybdenum cofactor guanylyltransferase [Cohnella pontilimi]TJY41138.1 molybdenum cofactor guanylyltransferase [Cohnella pontilimi]
MGSSSITGAILAGGPNSGMSGALKALLPIGGEPLIARQIREMRKICGEIIVVTNTPRPFFPVLDHQVRLITDYFPGCGPLGGFHAALHLARNPLVWVVGSDMPFISAEAARRLAEDKTQISEAAIPIIGKQPFPLHGVYDKRNADAAAKLLMAGDKRLDAFLGRIPWLGIPADGWTEEDNVGAFTFTIHKPEDYELAGAMARRELPA